MDSNLFGDLFVQLNISIPKHLTTDQKNLIQDLLKSSLLNIPMKETCCDKPKPVGTLKILPLAFLAAFGTLAVVLAIEIGIAAWLGMIP